MQMIDDQGWLSDSNQIVSPNFDDRPVQDDISLLVIHGISLPPGEYGNGCIAKFFTNNLDIDDHPYFTEIANSQVSAHLLIDRNGEITQFVPFSKRAWHAGASNYNGRERCNDFSIGIELEGCDEQPYTEQQYQSLADVIKLILKQYPKISQDCIVGHSDIAPGRKTDPGPLFDWTLLKRLLRKQVDG